MYKFIIGNGVFFPCKQKIIHTNNESSFRKFCYSIFKLVMNIEEFLMFLEFNFYLIYFILCMADNIS